MHTPSVRSLLLCAALATPLTAQMPLPGYVRTFTSATATRGFYFQTPVPILIIGLRVPDETGHGLQNVEVFQMTAPAPAFPATGSGTQVFYATGLPSGTIIPCALAFNAGDWVGVLGACGDTTTMRNSYGTPNFPSNVLGNAVTLIRFLTQTNIVRSGGNQPYSSEAAFEVSRVEVYVAGQSAAINYDAGAGIGTQPAPTLTTTALPIHNTMAALSLTQSYGANQGGIVILGRGRVSIPFLQGNLLVNPGFLLLLPFQGPLGVGANPMSLPIPGDPALTGAVLDFQGFVVVFPDVAMTNGTEWWLGL